MGNRLSLTELEKVDECVLNIICMHKIHKITLRKKGAITLQHHNHRAELKLLSLSQAVGAATPKCIRILLNWQANRNVVWRHRYRGEGTLPATPGHMRIMATRRARDWKSKTGPYKFFDSEATDVLFDWTKLRIARSLTSYDLHITKGYREGEFRLANNGSYYAGSLAGIQYSLKHWAYRICASGLANVSPLTFFPVCIDKPDEAGLVVLSYISIPYHKIERMDINNGHCPAAITGSENQAKYFAALCRYRALELASSRDHAPANDGG